MATTISVNGADGATLSRSTDVRLVQNDTQALVLHDQRTATRHGRAGGNAPQAIQGGPAGTLAVQLSESQIAQGAIHVHVVECSQRHRFARDSEVPIGRDLRLTAIGGIGGKYDIQKSILLSTETIHLSLVDSLSSLEVRLSLTGSNKNT